MHLVQKFGQATSICDDRFRNFQGFVLDTEDGSRNFRSKERDERLSIVFRRPPSKG